MLTPQITSPASSFGLEHIDSLFRYAVVLTHNRVEAEDLVQETFVRALEALDRLREDSNIRGWLFTILRNLWLNNLRRHRTGPQIVEVDADEYVADTLAGNSPTAHEILESEEDAKHVRAAIEKLPPEFREIIVLREYEELSYQEIASVLGCPAGTVMSRLGRARARLRALLTEENQGQIGRQK